MQLKIKRLSERAILPVYATEGAACFDLHACLPESDAAINTCPNATVTVPTGLSFEVPEGHVMLVYSRSGHGFKQNTRLANCVGVIDSDYRGEVQVKLTRDDGGSLFVTHGDRIAQAMIVAIPRVELIEAGELSDTERGAGGFGSTGHGALNGDGNESR